MTRLTHLALLAASALLVAKPARSEPPTAPKGSDLEISLVTASPGTEWFEWLGHSGILVANFATGRRDLYEYGVFSFDRKMLAGVITGDLEAGIRKEPASLVIKQFMADGRWVDIQKLSLTNAQKLEMLRRLELAVSPGHASERYRIVSDNCATRPRDLIDEITSGSLRSAGQKLSATTLRQNVLTLSMPPIVKLLMDLTFNSDIDGAATTWQVAALPGKLNELATSARIADDEQHMHPLVTESWGFGQVLPVSTWNENPLSLALLGVAVAIVPLLSLLTTTAAVSRAMSSASNILLGLTLGVPGALLLLGWLFTQHDFLFHNANLLVVNPVLLLAVPLGVAIATGSHRASRWAMRLWISATIAGAIGLIFALAPGHEQDNLRFYGLLLPVIATQAFVEWRHSSRLNESVYGMGTDSHFTSNGWKTQ